MKKIIFVAVMTIFALTVSAQTETGLRSGIEFNGSLSTYSDLSTAEKTFGFGAGYVLEYGFTPNLYLGSGLDFVQRGTKIDSWNSYLCSGALRSYNVLLPVNIGGRFNVSDNVSIFGQVGPYASFAIIPAKLEVGSRQFKGERFDWGFNGKLGVDICHQYRVFGGYELGMNKLWSDEGKNRSIVFGVAYMFN